MEGSKSRGRVPERMGGDTHGISSPRLFAMAGRNVGIGKDTHGCVSRGLRISNGPKLVWF